MEFMDFKMHITNDVYDMYFWGNITLHLCRFTTLSL